MRTRIMIDSATPAQVYNLTLAFQRTSAFDLPAQLTVGSDEKPTPNVTVGGSTMGWKSPYLSPTHAQALMREFRRLEAGMFDHADHDCTDRRNCEVPLFTPADHAAMRITRED